MLTLDVQIIHTYYIRRGKKFDSKHAWNYFVICSELNGLFICNFSHMTYLQIM